MEKEWTQLRTKQFKQNIFKSLGIYELNTVRDFVTFFTKYKTYLLT